MDLLVCVKEAFEPREFNTINGTCVAKDLVISDGINSFFASCFDKMAAIPVEVGHFYRVSLEFNVRKTNDGKYFQSVRVNNLAKLW